MAFWLPLWYSFIDIRIIPKGNNEKETESYMPISISTDWRITVNETGDITLRCYWDGI